MSNSFPAALFWYEKKKTLLQSNTERRQQEVQSFLPIFSCVIVQEYLSSLKLVHRDLAARNILIACGRVLKISDFGMTRDVYMSMDEVYIKQSRDIVPWRWMAPEAMMLREYSSASDV